MLLLSPLRFKCPTHSTRPNEVLVNWLWGRETEGEDSTEDRIDMIIVLCKPQITVNILATQR